MPVAWTWASKRFPRKGLESGVLVLLEMPSLPRTADDVRVACAPASAARRRTSAGVALGGQGTRRPPDSSLGQGLHFLRLPSHSASEPALRLAVVRTRFYVKTYDAGLRLAFEVFGYLGETLLCTNVSKSTCPQGSYETRNYLLFFFVK